MVDMKIEDYEKQIQKEIDPDLTIKVNPNHTDIAGVYWQDIFIGVSVPPVEIKETLEPSYVDGVGYPYKNVQLATDLIKGKVAKFKKAKEDDPDLFK